MDIPLAICVNNKKKKRHGKKPDPPASESLSSSPKNFPIPRSYATVSTPTQKTPVIDYPPLQSRYVAPPHLPPPSSPSSPHPAAYELFPKPAFHQEPLREVYYNVPRDLQQQSVPQYITPQYAALQQPTYSVYAQQYQPQPQMITHNPYSVYVQQQPVQRTVPQQQHYQPPQQQHYQPPQMRQPAKQMTAGTIRLLNNYEKFWAPMCKDPDIRDRVRESFNYFPN